MKNDRSGLRDKDRPQQRAKARLASGQRASDPSDQGADRLLQELQIHQVQLEMQNEELRRVQRELEASQARYFNLYDLAPVGYLTLSERGVILEANLTAATMLETTRDALIKQPFTRFILGEDRKIYRLHCKPLIETGEPRRCELRMVKEDGTAFWGCLEVTVARNGDNEKIDRVVISNINERKQIEDIQAFLAQTTCGAQEEPFFRVLARYLSKKLDMFYVCIDRLEGEGLTARTVAVWCDDHFEDNVTYALKDTPCGDVVGKMVCCFPAGVSKLFPNDRVLQDLRAESYVGVTLFGRTGKPIGLIAVIGRRPLANPSLAETMLKLLAVRAAGEMEQMEAEEALHDSERKFRTLFENNLNGVALHEIVLDELGNPVDFIFLEANPAFEKHTGMRVADILGKRVTQVIPDIRKTDLIQTYGKVALTGEAAEFEMFFEPLQRHYHISAYQIGNRRFAVVFEDITERKRVEIELKERTAQLENTNAELESFSYSVSHDLQAPLRAIDGYSRMILRKHADTLHEETLGKLNIIRDNTQMMGRLINDLLAFSRLGRAKISTARLDMGGMIREIWKEMEDDSPDHRMILKVASLPPCIGDRGLIKQALINLISNAIKFTKNREKARIEAGGDIKGNESLYYIRDNGVGFDMQYYDKLFGVFQRLHTIEEFEGTGVGLAIAQRIIHRHGGRIWAEGKVDKGATFYFTLPNRQE